VAPTGVSRSRALTSFLPPIKLSLKDSIACKRWGVRVFTINGRFDMYIYSWIGVSSLPRAIGRCGAAILALQSSHRFIFSRCLSSQIGNAPSPASARRISCEGFVMVEGLWVLPLTLIMSFIFPFFRRLSSLRCCRG
jgi:hypothetical protein